MNKDKIIAKQEELLIYQKKLIYELDKQPNSIGREWRERVEGLEIEIKELSSELSALKAEAEKEVSDEDIREYGLKIARIHIADIEIFISGAKALRDGLIKKGE